MATNNPKNQLALDLGDTAAKLTVRDLVVRGEVRQAFRACNQVPFDSDYLTARKVMESGKLGKVFEIATHYDYWREAFLEYAREGRRGRHAGMRGCVTLQRVPDNIY